MSYSGRHITGYGLGEFWKKKWLLVEKDRFVVEIKVPKEKKINISSD